MERFTCRCNQMGIMSYSLFLNNITYTYTGVILMRARHCIKSAAILVVICSLLATPVSVLHVVEPTCYLFSTMTSIIGIFSKQLRLVTRPICYKTKNSHGI